MTTPKTLGQQSTEPTAEQIHAALRQDIRSGFRSPDSWPYALIPGQWVTDRASGQAKIAAETLIGRPIGLPGARTLNAPYLRTQLRRWAVADRHTHPGAWQEG